MTIARDNIDALTGLRFIAAFTIAFGHSYPDWLAVAGIGMPLFFTLSGFIIHYVYSEAFGAGWRGAAREFAIARVSRIYPLYFVLFAYAFVFTPMGPPLRLAANFPTLAACVLGYWSWWPFQVDGNILAGWYFGLSWSVSTELFFYVAYALCLYRLARIQTVRRCLVALIGLCVAAYLVFYALFLTRDAWEPFALAQLPQFPARTADFNNSFYRWLLYVSPYLRIFEFIGGVLTCQLFLLIRRRPLAVPARPGLVAWAGVTTLIALFAGFAYLGPREPWLAAGNHSLPAFLVTLHMNFLFAPSCYLLILAMALGGSAIARVLAGQIPRFLGDISYSTYLTHPYASRVMFHTGLDSAYAVPHLAIVMSLILLLSYLFYRVVEAPAKRFLRRLFASGSLGWRSSPTRV